MEFTLNDRIKADFAVDAGCEPIGVRRFLRADKEIAPSRSTEVVPGTDGSVREIG
jgi:hypothetical protein